MSSCTCPACLMDNFGLDITFSKTDQEREQKMKQPPSSNSFSFSRPYFSFKYNIKQSCEGDSLFTFNKYYTTNISTGISNKSTINRSPPSQSSSSSSNGDKTDVERQEPKP